MTFTKVQSLEFIQFLEGMLVFRINQPESSRFRRFG